MAGVGAGPGHVPTVQVLARLMLRDGRKGLAQIPETIALEGETAEWRAWVREQLLRAQGPQPPIDG